MPEMRKGVAGSALLALLSVALVTLLLQHGGVPAVLEVAVGKATHQHSGVWQSLAVGDAPVDGDRGREASGVEEPAWLKAKKQLTSHETMEEAKELRSRLSEADSTLGEAQRQLLRAEGQSEGAGRPHHSGNSDTVLGVKVTEFLPTAQPWEKETPKDAAKLAISARHAVNGQTVKVSWSGIADPNEEDFIAIYTPPSADHHDFLETHLVTESVTWEKGSGELEVKLFNYRQPHGYEARYFRKGAVPEAGSQAFSPEVSVTEQAFCPKHHCSGDSAFFLVASSNRVLLHENEPTQIRLALTGKPTEMRISWTSAACPGLPFGGPLVVYSNASCAAEAPGDDCRYEHKVVPLYRSYAREDMCGPPANVAGARGFIDPGHIYDALLTDLVPGAKYYYSVGCQDAPHAWHMNRLSRHSHLGWKAGILMTPERSFSAAPWVHKDTPVSIIAFGDSGVSADQPYSYTSKGMPEAVAAGVTKEVEAGTADLVAHLGDIAYANGRGFMWENWGALMEPVSRRVPFMVTVGNHEYDHLPVLTLSLSHPTTASRVSYRATPTRVGPGVATHAEGISAKVVLAATGGGDSGGLLCSTDGGGGEEAQRALAEFEGAMVVVRDGGCSLAAKALVAQQFGAVALLVSPALPSFRGMLGAEADDSAEGVRIPVVQVSEEDAADLGVWLEEYDVEALLESSERLAANDPSLTKAQREASPDGFHPENGGYWDEGGECGVPYAQRFHMPGNGNGNFWYTYEYGSVTMVHISTEHDFTPGSPQHSWLEKTLGAVDREATAWVVVAMHRSIYGRSMSQGNQNTSMILQEYLEPLLKEHKVDVVLSGHEHRYLRTAPVWKDINKGGSRGGAPIYVVAGTGGGKLEFRARDRVHESRYCVGGAFPKKRCGVDLACTGDTCDDYETCCDTEDDEDGIGHFYHCGVCSIINATGPVGRDPRKYGWVRKMQSGFGYLKLNAKSSKELQIQFVQSFRVNYPDTVDVDGRSLHLPVAQQVGCADDCEQEGELNGEVWDSMTIRRTHPASSSSSHLAPRSVP